ncbi:MAG: hypothetical protein K8T20_14375 [Planctomycetes bacterium]|nr:hypothetical protein [Planctomycetota bacterium]
MKYGLAVLLLTTLAGCAGLTPAEQRVVDESLANESQLLWQQINWAPTFEEARLRAIREDKPLFVVLVVNEKGVKHAEHC